MSWSIRDERAADANAIRAMVERAFAGHHHSDGTEPEIVDRLRRDRTPMLSLVADESGSLVGHIAFSPVSIGDGSRGWFGLGPLSVEPARQNAGIGSALCRAGLERLRTDGAKGCVVLGEPGYYARFGFEHDPGLTFPGVPQEYFQRLVFDGRAPAGEVSYAAAFG